MTTWKCDKCEPSTKRKRTPVSERVCYTDPDTELFLDIYFRCRERMLKSSDRLRSDMIGLSVDIWLRRSCRHRRVAIYITQIQKNHFMNEAQKTHALDVLYATQKAYYGFQRFKFYLKKRSYGLTHDMEMEEVPPKNRVTFFDGTMMYTFSRRDITRIIYNALTYHDSSNVSFFPRAIPPKNPYTNIEFSLASLYEIFLQLRSVPIIMECYRRVGFSLQSLEKQYGDIVRRAQIDRYIHDMEESTFEVFGRCYVEYINEIVFCNTVNMYDFKFNLHSDFPSKIFHSDFKRSIELYIRYIYTHSHEDKETYLNQLSDLAVDFFTKNPRYGRKIIQKEYVGGKMKYVQKFYTTQTFYTTA